MNLQYKKIQKDRLDGIFANNEDLKDFPIKPQSWIRTIREALGMTSTELAKRLKINQSAVTQLEHREQLGTVTLKTLREAAHALDCDLYYVIAPRISLEATVNEQAIALARKKLDLVSHSMALEAQSVSPKQRELQIKQLAEEIKVSMPRRLWNND